MTDLKKIHYKSFKTEETMTGKKKIISIIMIAAILLTTLGCFLRFGAEGAKAEKELTVSFYPLGGNSVGDSCIIRYGDTQILIDAGPGKMNNEDSIRTIISQMEKALKGDRDKVWEYVIVTHGDSDHISSFSTNEWYDKDTGVIHEMRERHNVTFDRLIDFDTVDKNGEPLVSYDSLLYKRYKSRRADSFNKYNTASELCGGKAYDFVIDEDCKLTILYNPYYDGFDLDESVGTLQDSTKKNVASVCVMVTYKHHSFLFTGDLEEYDSTSGRTEEGYNKRVFGETYLYDYNKEYFENGVTFYKAAHHGSTTSNSEAFIDNIAPQYIVVPTIAGTSEHNENAELTDRFPSQAVMSRFLKYTDMILIPSKAVLGDDGKTAGVEEYYGEITIKSDGTKITALNGESGATSAEPITETDWFKANRKDNGGALRAYILALPETMGAMGRCTLLKYRNIDILIDCGIVADAGNYKLINTMYFADKLLDYCTDNVLEYVIISNAETVCMSNTIGSYDKNGPKNDGIFGMYTVNNLIDFGTNTNYSGLPDSSWLKRYMNQRKELPGTRHNNVADGETYQIAEKFTITFFNLEAFNEKNEADYSVCTLIDFDGKKLLFTGNLSNSNDKEKALAEDSRLSDCTFLLAGNSGDENSTSDELIAATSPEYLVINSVAGININGKTFLERETAKRLWSAMKKEKSGDNIYLTYQYSGGKIQPVCGDIVFFVYEDEISLKGMSATVSLIDSYLKN